MHRCNFKTRASLKGTFHMISTMCRGVISTILSPSRKNPCCVVSSKISRTTGSWMDIHHDLSKLTWKMDSLIGFLSFNFLLLVLYYNKSSP
jgi:hypothetical protein